MGIITAADKLLVHLPFPAPPGWTDDIARRFPALRVHWEVCGINSGSDSDPDLLPAEVWDGVTMLVMYQPPSPALTRNVRFVQIPSAGWDLWFGHALFLNHSIPFCNSMGAHAPQIAEWVISTWLAQTHHLGVYAQRQREENWEMAIRTHPTTASIGLRMGILGYGTIGRQCGRLAQALGMEVYAFTHRERSTPETRHFEGGYFVPNTGDPEGTIPTKWFSGSDRDAVDNFISQDLDILVLALPFTATNRGLIGRKQFQIMSKRKTFVSNISRGPIVDTDALVEALNEGMIRGAALDVTDPEPLPKGHPLWKCPNVFISPHVAWQSTSIAGWVMDIVLQNLERLDKDKPLLNLISNSSRV